MLTDALKGWQDAIVAITKQKNGAIEAEVLQAQHPVAYVMTEEEQSRTTLKTPIIVLGTLPRGTNLYAEKQPPAPCPKCAQHEIDFALEHDDKIALQAKVAEQAALIEKCEKALIEARDDVYSELIRAKQSAGYKRYDDEIKRQMAQLVRHDEALAAIAAQKGGA